MRRMKYPLAGVAMLAVLFAVGGCASGVSDETLGAQISPLNEQISALGEQISSLSEQISSLDERIEGLDSRIAGSESQVAVLSSMSAYQLWFDQYYSLGTFSFSDVNSFNKSCGRLISEVNDADTVAAWNLYIQADKAYYDLLATLPEDTSTWTGTQYDQWTDSNTERSEALGQVGTTLLSAISEGS